MRLNTHDEIEIDGLHPRNPITGATIPSFLQVFAVVHPQEGDWIDPRDLYPMCEEGERIAMARVVRLNGVKLR